MKKTTVSIVSTVMLVGLLFYSCQKSDETLLENTKKVSTNRSSFDDKLFNKFRSNFSDSNLKRDYEIINGTVHFKNQESFKETMANFDAFKSDIENNPNFVSSIKYLGDLSEALSKTIGTFEKNQIVEKNGDYLLKINDQISLNPTLSATPFTNKNGVFYIGKVLVLLDKKKQFLIYDGDERKVNQIKSGKIDKSVVQEFSSMNVNSRISSECLNLTGSSLENGYLTSVSVSGSTLVLPDGNGQFSAFESTFLFGFYLSSSTSEGCTVYVNYRAKLLIFGNEVNSTTTDSFVSSQTTSVADFRIFGFRTVTQAEIDNTQGQISVVLEERNGYFQVTNTPQISFYRCN